MFAKMMTLGSPWPILWQDQFGLLLISRQKFITYIFANLGPGSLSQTLSILEKKISETPGPINANLYMDSL